jgi:hypothetical protein
MTGLGLAVEQIGFHSRRVVGDVAPSLHRGIAKSNSCIFILNPAPPSEVEAIHDQNRE